MELKEILFGTLEPQEKLERINTISGKTLLKPYVMLPVIRRIVKECGKEGNFRVKHDRQLGNRWNSIVKGIYNYKGEIFVDVYIQSDKTDTNIPVLYDNLLGGGVSRVESHIGNATYREDEKEAVVRGLLSEYVYYKYIEKEAREAQEKIDNLLHYSITNPVFDYYYKRWDGWHRMDFDKDLRNRYYGGKEAVEEYAKAHVDELTGKSVSELQEIYKQVFIGKI